jgi:hypothetical protein
MLKTCRFPLEKGIKKLDKITKKLLEVINCFPGEVHPAQFIGRPGDQIQGNKREANLQGWRKPAGLKLKNISSKPQKRR